MWTQLLWVGPEDAGVAVRDRGAASAGAWLIRSRGAYADALQGSDVVVDATGLAPAGHDPELLTTLATTPPPRLRRVVVAVTTAWLGDAADPVRAGRAGFAVAAARSLALRLAPGTTVNTVAVAGEHDAPRARLARLAAQPDATALAHWIDWFALPDNDYVTGQTINLCGGASLLSSLSV